MFAAPEASLAIARRSWRGTRRRPRSRSSTPPRSCVTSRPAPSTPAWRGGSTTGTCPPSPRGCGMLLQLPASARRVAVRARSCSSRNGACRSSAVLARQRRRPAPDLAAQHGPLQPLPRTRGTGVQPRIRRHRRRGRRVAAGRARRRTRRVRRLPGDGRPTGLGRDQRMYVTLAGRGKKIGSALLAELERVAVGVSRFAWFEFGPRQPEAHGMFESAGYAVCEPWGPFIGKDLSICMEKLRPTATG